MLSLDEESVFLDLASAEKDIICSRSQTSSSKSDKSNAWDSITMRLSEKLGRTFTVNKVQRRWQNILQRMKGHFGRRLAELCGITGTSDVNTISPDRVAQDLPQNDRRVLQIVGIESLKAFYYINSASPGTVNVLPSLSYKLDNSMNNFYAAASPDSVSMFSRLSQSAQHVPPYEVKVENNLDYLGQQTSHDPTPPFKLFDTEVIMPENVTSISLSNNSVNVDGTATTSGHSVQSFEVADVADCTAIPSNNHVTQDFGSKAWYKCEKRRLRICRMEIEVDKMRLERDLLALQAQKMRQELADESTATECPAKRRKVSEDSSQQL